MRQRIDTRENILANRGRNKQISKKQEEMRALYFLALKKRGRNKEIAGE